MSVNSFATVLVCLQCRLRGKIDSGGVVSALLEERFSMGLNFLLSAEVRINGLINASCAT